MGDASLPRLPCVTNESPVPVSSVSRRPPAMPSGRAEAEGGPLLLDERAEADAETDGDLVEGDVHDPAKQRDALAELDDGHRVGRVGREGARRDTDHGEALDGALAAEGHGPPGALVTGRTELPRRDGELPAPPPAHPRELPPAPALGGVPQRDDPPRPPRPRPRGPRPGGRRR